MKRIRITYETITPESAERGDVASQGWIDEQGVDFQSVEQLAEYLRDAGATEWEGRWWSEPDGHTDPQTGEHTRQSYHPVDGEWTDEELEQVCVILEN